MDDLTLKYQKLAQEYAKLRAQNQVLKRAVVEEKDNHGSLKEVLRGKEQLLRRSEQEMDSLVFRNQQMERRVELLQEELEKQSSSKSKKKGKADSQNMSTHSNAINEDLRNKIRENEILHKQVYEADTKTRQIERQMTDELTVAKQESKQAKEALEGAESKYKLVIDKLQEGRALLELQLHTAQDGEKSAQLLADETSEKLAKVGSELGRKVTYLSQVVSDTIVFNDCASPNLSVLNVPPHDRRSQAKASELLKGAKVLITELCTTLLNLHTYTEQRAKIYPIDSSFEPLSVVNTRLCDLLHNTASVVRPIGDFFDKFCDASTASGSCPVTLHTAIGLGPFAKSFGNYVTYFEKMMPYLVQSIDEECNTAVSSQMLQSRNSDFRQLYQRVVPCFVKLHSYLKLISSASDSSHLLPPYNEKAVLQKILSILNEMHLLFKDMSKAFNGKVALEHQLPTASTSLKSTDEFLLSAFLTLSTIMAKLAAFISDNSEFFTQKSPYRTRGISLISSDSLSGSNNPPAASPVVISLCQRSVSYLAKINPAAPPPSVPYKTAIQDRATALSSAESKDSLVKRVQESAERINKLEQEKEHWLLESQLLQMKLDKEKQRAAVPAVSAGEIIPNPALQPTVSSTGRSRTESLRPTDTSMLGNIDKMSEPFSEEDTTDSREELIKQHLTSRLTDMSSKLQHSESKTLSLQTECHSLHKRLDLAEQKREKIQEEYNKANQKISQLQDELAVTRKNYEDQLSLMSDHLAAMNDKLSTQKDEIESLKLSSKSKKSRLKVPGRS